MCKLSSLTGIASWFFALGALAAFGQSATVASPDGKLVLKLLIQTSDRLAPGTGRLGYELSFEGKPVITLSALNLTLEGKQPLGTAVRMAGTNAGTIDEIYHLVTGKASTVRNQCNTLTVNLEEPSGEGRKFTIEARAYNDAVAFRYVIPEQPALKEFRLVKETSEFCISKDATTYGLVLPNFRSMYESEFLKLPITAYSNQGGVSSKVLLGLPLLMDVPGVVWLAISDADLRGYSSMYLVNPSGNWAGLKFESQLAPQVEHPEIAVTGTLPHHSAWRVIQVARHPAQLIDSTILTSLNPPTTIQDTSWIRAGKASWDWWSGSIGRDGKPAFTTETMKFYVDFAAESGFEYMLIDAGWAQHDITQMNGRVDVPEVVRYAATRHVKVWIWLGYGQTAKQMDEAFPLYEKWGVAGVKIDFIERDDQEGIEFYYRAAEVGAQHHLMVDFHGATKPSGIDRTFPNIMGYEAVGGMEQSKAGARDNPDHRVTIPFTRMLAGRMDFTPGGFDNVTRDDFLPRQTHPVVMGTRAQQLAMYVVYESPFQMVSDCPQAYAGQPEFQFIKDVPATWDETRALNGVPGEYVTIARRSARDWFVGSMCNWTPRDLTVPLTFLPEGRFEAVIYSDGADADRSPKQVRIETRRVKKADILKLHLAPGGGCAIRLRPLK